MPDTRELFPNIDLGERPSERGCAKPIGRMRARQPKPRRVPAGILMLGELRRLMVDQHGELIAELRALHQQRRDHGELPAMVLRRLVNIERHLGLVETPAAPRVSSRRPVE